MEQQNSPPHLPQEIIEEILVRLSVKSLLRLHCVSKTWRAIISSDSFIKAHLEKSSNNKSFKHRHIIFGNSIVRANQLFSRSFLRKPPPATAVDFEYPMCGPRDNPCIIGSCNGLLCIRKNTRDLTLTLWNPSTRKFKQLPPVIDGSERDHTRYWTSGFGYDESNDDYKVFVKLVNSRYGVERKGLVKTYVLKTDSWRKVGVFTFDSDFYALGIYASGKLHWNRYASYGVVRGIVSFDLENEIFGTVELPDGVERCFLGRETIDGCLCCISASDHKPNELTDYWLLKEYGVNDSWHKFATLERPLLVTSNGRIYDYFIPFFLSSDGDVLCRNFGFDTYTIFFKENDGFLGYKVHGLCTDLPPVIYFESLVGL